VASADDHIRRGRIATMKLWLDDCTDEEVSGDPQLAIVAAWLHFHFGDHETAERFAAAAAKGDLAVTSTDGTTSLRSSLMLLRATLAPNGVAQMLADAESVCAAEGRAANTRWLLDGVRAAGNANLLLGRPDEAVAAFREAVELTTGHPEASHVKIACLGFLAFALAETGSWPAARKSAHEATAVSAAERLEQTLLGGIALTARAMVLVHDGDFDRGAADLAKARRTGHLVGGARWFNADMNIRWGNISLDLGDRPRAQEHAETARAALDGYPDPGMLPSRVAQLDERLANPSELTPAEIRILPFLPTHLSVKEVAERLQVSPATVKTHVASVYAKLGATSRSDAVEKMQHLGLALDPVGARREYDAHREPS
jgi:LuxR family maltose regulon positive regulatory protein